MSNKIYKTVSVINPDAQQNYLCQINEHYTQGIKVILTNCERDLEWHRNFDKNTRLICVFKLKTT